MVLLGWNSLAPAELYRFAEAVRSTALGDRSTRQIVLDRLGADFDPPRDDRDLVDILNILQATQADDVTFDQLLGRIRTYGPDDPAYLHMLDLVATRLRRSPLAKQELHDLLAIELRPPPTPQQLAQGVRVTWPDVPARVQVSNMREAALVLLDAQNLEAGVGRLVRFVDWVVVYAVAMREDVKADELRAWIRMVIDTHHLPLDQTAPPVRVSAHDQESPVLLVELDPETTAADGFAVNAWVWRPGAGFEPLGEWPGQGQWYRLEGLEREVDDLIELALEQLGDVETELQVEFWLDYDMVSHAVDLWKLGSGRVRVPPPLGADYRVVVRPRRPRPLRHSERLRWRTHWQALQTATESVADLSIWVQDEDTYTDAGLWARLRENRGQIVVVPLGPADKVNTRLHTVLCELFEAGLPVALGVRRSPADAAAVLDTLKEKLTTRPLADLPECVRSWRTEAFQTGEGHFGHDLVLLWDDYDRWPDARLGSNLVGGHT